MEMKIETQRRMFCPVSERLREAPGLFFFQRFLNISISFSHPSILRRNKIKFKLNYA